MPKTTTKPKKQLISMIWWKKTEEEKPKDGADVLFIYTNDDEIIRSGFYEDEMFKQTDDDGNEIECTPERYVEYWAYTNTCFPLKDKEVEKYAGN